MVFAASIGSDLFKAILQGTPPGAVYALIALGFVLTYKTSGVFNLAFGAQAYVSAALFFKLHVQDEWAILPAFLISVVLVAPLLGLLLERLIFRYLRQSGAVPKLVVTIGLSVAIPALFDLAANFKAVAGTTPVGIAPDGANVFYDPFGVYAFSRNEVVTLIIAVIATVGLLALFKFTALGLQMRAVVESSRMTELNGIAADRVSAFAWALSSFFAGLAGVLIAPRFNTLAAADFFNLVVVAIAAAAVGKLVSLPRALLGGLGLGILIALVNTFLPRWSNVYTWLRPIQDNVIPAIPFIVLFAVLVFVPSLRRTKEATDPLTDVDPPPRSLGAVVRDKRATTISWLIGGVVFVVLGYIVHTEADRKWLFLVTSAAVYGIIFLSITLVTGMAGRISLCQGAFAAVGAFSVYQLSDQMPVLLACVVGGFIGAAVGAVLSLPIRKLDGVWVAIATLAFAYFFDAVVVRLPFVGGGDSTLLGTKVPRPSLGPIDFKDNRSFLWLSVVVLILVGLAVYNLGRGSFGRVLVALRGSEVAAGSIGISPARSRLIAFAISAFVAAIGGAFLAMLQGNVNYGTNFSPYGALFWIVIVVTLSVRTVEGAIQAAGAFILFDAVILKGTIFGWILRDPDRIPGFLPIDGKWLFVLFGFGAIQYARHPEGILEYQKRKRVVKRIEKKQRQEKALAAAAAGLSSSGEASA
jgi:branched-subunit amino acid ABC-type transport system permease component